MTRAKRMPSQQRILVVSPKEAYELGSPSLGIGYLLSWSRKAGGNAVHFHDENFVPAAGANAALAEAVHRFRPDFVAVSCPSSAVRRVVEIARAVKEARPEAVVFAGGYHPTVEPEATLRALPDLSFVMPGQAEAAFGNLGQDWRNLSGIGYLDDDRYVETPLPPPVELDQLPYPDRRDFDRRYFEPRVVISGVFGKTATLLTSRGCPYDCSFCANKAIQNRVRYHSVDYVLGEIDYIFTQLGRVDYLYFLDVLFLSRWDRVEDLCRKLVASGILKGTRWAATAAANLLTRERARLLKEAGCFYLSLGLESNSARVLKMMGKVATPADNDKAADACARAGILMNSAFLFGLPGEEEEDLEETIRFVREHEIFAAGVNAMKPLPGSPYYRRLLEQGLLERNLESWHRASSIHHDGEYFNDRIPVERYETYRRRFRELCSRREPIDDWAANWRAYLRYDRRRLMNSGCQAMAAVLRRALRGEGAPAGGTP